MYQLVKFKLRVFISCLPTTGGNSFLNKAKLKVGNSANRVFLKNINPFGLNS